MRHQHVGVDIWKMAVTSLSYLGLAFTAWVFLRLVNACFWLPSYLSKQQTQVAKLLEGKLKYSQGKEENKSVSEKQDSEQDEGHIKDE